MDKAIHCNSSLGHFLKYVLVGLIGITFLAGSVLISSTSSATSTNDSVVDEVNITVPISCSLTGTGMNTHNAEIPNGTYRADIGNTTLKAFCNDNEGFAIYAIGYTDDTDGKNVLSNSGLGSTYDIATGTATSGNSQWAMKLSTITNPEPTYSISIQNSFDSFHNVPNEYTLVAKRTSATDIGDNAEGSTLTTTYQAYIDGTQPAGIYTGQVKYTLVHPSEAKAPKPKITKVIDINYDSYNNGDPFLYFDPELTQTQNTVTYSITCETESRQFDILKTSNLSDSGVQNGAYIDETFESTTFLYPGASKIKVVVNYGLTANTGGISIDGENEQYVIYSEENNLSGSETYIIEGDYIIADFQTWDTNNLENGYDYGVYISIYPLDENNEEMSFKQYSDCEWETISGTYLEPLYGRSSDFNGWTGIGSSEGSVLSFLSDNMREYINSSSITIEAAFTTK